MKKRNAAIELFRCACIFGVCLLHALEQGGYAGPHRGLDNLMMPSVVGFVFISGWFGIRLTARHVWRLLSISVYCALIPTVCYDWLYLGHGGGGHLLNRFWDYYTQPWFLWTYFALMMVAPLFDALFEHKDGGADMGVLRRVIPVVLLAFGWSYAATKLPVFKVYLPKVGGFGGFSLLAFVGIYLTARTCRYYELDHRVTPWQLMLLALVSGVFCWIGLGHYHSPFAVVFAGSMFLLFKRLPIDRMKWVSGVVLWLSASTFSIYLLHRNNMGMAWMRNFEDTYIAGEGWNYYIVCFLAALVFFFGALALDLPRRLFASMSKRSACSAGGGR